jgi:small GTP-binding protein
MSTLTATIPGEITRKTTKFIVIGSSGVGKTAILKRLLLDTFVEQTNTTVGVDFLDTTMEVDGQNMQIQIWDTAGQERYRSISQAYYRSASAIILVFDLSDRASFGDLPHWLNDIHNLCDPNAIVMLIGNKRDLVQQRAVAQSEAEAFAQMHQLSYLETSALSGDNIQDAFHRAAAAVSRKNLAGLRADPGSIAPETSFDGRWRNCC